MSQQEISRREFLKVATGTAGALAVARLTPAWSAEGFVSIFDGKTLNGWHVSAKTGHSGASGHKSGGRWVIEDGAIVGSQDLPGNGGIALQVHGGGDFTKQFVRYRHIRVKTL